MSCPEDELKVCPQCKSFVVPFQFDDHVLDCSPIGALDSEQANQSWFARLTPCERNAVYHVNGVAMEQSRAKQHGEALLATIRTMENGKYALSAQQTLDALHRFLEWDCPIIVRVHIGKVMAHLLEDTHYRNLFEIGTGSGYFSSIFSFSDVAAAGSGYDRSAMSVLSHIRHNALWLSERSDGVPLSAPIP